MENYLNPFSTGAFESQSPQQSAMQSALEDRKKKVKPYDDSEEKEETPSPSEKTP